jgi:broad specificity phosphatase PhoE
LHRSIWLIRHGNRLDFSNPEWLDTAERPHDCPLSPNGEQQARDTGARLRREPVAHLFSSPFIRAAQTATIIGNAIGKPVKIEAGLSEILSANWFPDRHDLLSAAELADRFNGIDITYRSQVEPEYPETRELMTRRSKRVVELLTQQFDGTLVFVGHGGIFSGIAPAIAGAGCGIHTTTCCLIRFDQDMASGGWRLAADGRDTSHLSWVEPQIRLA